MAIAIPALATLLAHARLFATVILTTSLCPVPYVFQDPLRPEMQPSFSQSSGQQPSLHTLGTLLKR